MKLYKLAILAILAWSGSSASSQTKQNILVPTPLEFVQNSGMFTWNRNTQLSGNDHFIGANEELKRITSSFKQLNGPKNSIVLVHDKSISNSEGYRIEIAAQQIKILAPTSQAANWAVATVKQLAGISIFEAKEALLPCAKIVDQPKYHWRGMHIDVARHFFDMEYLHKLVDRLVFYKFNKLHLHLSDDQGWRIEIKKYPELTEKGAWRTYNKHDSVCLDLAKDNPNFQLPEKHFKMVNGIKQYGGFYTQEDMKALIEYADKRGVEIIPEIDMPGHMMAAIKQFPWLTASKILHTGGDFSEPICPCKESTYTFAENVFAEIANLFPSKYIHLGADEVKTDGWKDVPECDEIMKREGLKNLDELQSYFVRRMDKFFASKGKKLIGWDEILKGGAPTNATIMYWRAWVPDAPKKAALNGNEMILLPGEYCYFDAKQDANSLKKVLSFDTDKYGLTNKEKELVLGVQAAAWSEYIPTESQFEYMVFPRLLAMAENAWATQKPSWEVFSQKMNRQYPILDALKIGYRMPDLSGFSANSVFIDQTNLKIINPLSSSVIHYTTDGSKPTEQSKIYVGNVEIKQDMEVKFIPIRPNGIKGDVYTIHYKKQPYSSSKNLMNPAKGLNFSFYPKFYRSVEAISEQDKTSSSITEAIEISADTKGKSFGTKHQGYFYAPKDAIYTFYLKSDDGSNLYIDDTLLIDNDGLHSAFEKSAQVALKAGYHPFLLKFIEGGGGFTLNLEYEYEGITRRSVHAADFAH
ncbi:family 20 glycosylhydrolase [Pedobacter sp. MW01-1-1]|uniref:family 20 glycosylhydrolase n=1 Tax=Pedobacter sp. MW01-1-1 TaxID=3383027 RepID=UPI003FEECBFA